MVGGGACACLSMGITRQQHEWVAAGNAEAEHAPSQLSLALPAFPPSLVCICHPPLSVCSCTLCTLRTLASLQPVTTQC